MVYPSVAILWWVPGVLDPPKKLYEHYINYTLFNPQTLFIIMFKHIYICMYTMYTANRTPQKTVQKPALGELFPKNMNFSSRSFILFKFLFISYIVDYTYQIQIVKRFLLYTLEPT